MLKEGDAAPAFVLADADMDIKHGLALKLLADTEGEVCRLFGVLQEKHREGETVGRLAIQRSTFILDREGVVRHAFHGVNPRGHAAEVLKLVRQLCKGN